VLEEQRKMNNITMNKKGLNNSMIETMEFQINYMMTIEQVKLVEDLCKQKLGEVEGNGKDDIEIQEKDDKRFRNCSI